MQQLVNNKRDVYDRETKNYVKSRIKYCIMQDITFPVLMSEDEEKVGKRYKKLKWTVHANTLTQMYPGE